MNGIDFLKKIMAERPTPQATFKRMTDNQPTVFYGAPTGFAGMLASPALPEKKDIALRLCSSAGEALPADLGERFSARYGVEIIDGIGSTEMLHIFISHDEAHAKPGATGTVVPGYLACVLDDEVLPQLQAAQRNALAAMGLTRHRASNDARALQQALLQLRRGRPHAH